ncbi:TonB-dependent receptor [Sphingomonas sp. MAH-20]|uniref:TonB-dependent receptor n=1 Tax=Sphingomonas horti TaxID=2682842 RepID=A0A6I4J048_9SPHN|nr:MULTISPECIES: TonB-dependent receptor [Sphingomonas]MBA2920029.1 TonB-dependent receptor [Sphingomonas sp. CGMCC 1.13658]MVO77909.1 TonB-dependent receptor [Sphingomonas horti]
MNRPATLLGGTALAVLSIVTATPSLAQTPVNTTADAGSQETIVVTGSRIRRNPLDQSSPVVTLDQSSLAQTGLTSVADILQRLPSASGGLNSKVNNSGNLGNPPDGGGVGAGSAEIDLRYLSAKRTLVLVDGLRFVNGTSASGIPATVDINAIPASMIDRVEVLQAGASPLYGSDAIAGVVNIITVAQQEGLRASAQYGAFRQGDGDTFNADISYGVKGETTNLVFGASYVKQSPVRSANRSISLFPNPGQTSCTDPVGGCSSAAVNGRFLTDFGNQTISNPPDSTPTLAELRPFTSADRFNFAPFNYLLTPSERYGAWLSFRQELTDKINLRLKAQYNRRNSQNQAAFEPLFIGPDAGNGAGSLFDTLSFDATNPFNPFGVTLSAGRPGQPAQNYSFIARRLVEAGQRTFDQTVDTLSATATLDGSFMVGGHEWYWDANALFGINDAHQSFTGNVRADRVAQAIGPIANCTAPCVPLNLFGGLGSITPAMLDWIAFTEHDRSKQELYDYTLNLSGNLFDLPAGPVGFAVGYEHRIQIANFIPDPIVSAGLGADIPAQPAAGRYNVDEVYGEVRIPLLKDTPFFYSLEVDGAIRHSSYSISGQSTTYTATGLWKPVEDLLLRGAYTTGFRAPSLGELFGGRSRFDLPVVDPCTSDPSGLFQTNATVRANCIADGVPADGSYAEPPGQLPVITRGNINLKPETSRNITFGAVYAPAWARNSGFASTFSLEANYYDIRVKKAIGAVDPNLTLRNCALLGDAASCALTVRTNNGFVNEIDGTLQNLDSIRTRGIDLTGLYRTPETGIGSFGLAVNATWLLKYVLSASNGFVVIDRKGTERGSPDQAFPKFKGNATVDWSLNDTIAASFTGRYISGVTEINPNDGLPNRMHSRFYGDVQLTFTPGFAQHRFAFTIGVNNVFDTDPPPCFSCSLNNFDPTTYDVPGQFGYARISYKM